MDSDVFGVVNSQLIDQIYDGICIRQGFRAIGRKLVSIEIYFATYKRENPGFIHVSIIDKKNRLLKEVVFDSARLQDNSYREIGFDVDLFVGEDYELRIWTEAVRAGHAPTVMTGASGHGKELFIGHQWARKRELMCRMNYDQTAKASLEEIVDGSVPGIVSIVIPHYNCEELLAKCLASIARQTYKALQVIVVDDGSRNKGCLAGTIEAFKSLLPLVYLEHEENRGAPAARNSGAEKAIGEYLFFCDADVELFAGSIETLVRTLIEVSAADFAYGGFEWGPQKVPPNPFDLARLRDRNYITTMSMMRRRVFPGFDERLKRHQDWDLWLTITDNGSIGVCCGKYLFRTPVRDGISTDTNIPMMDSVDLVRKKHNL
jgi:hypothetical protein